MRIGMLAVAALVALVPGCTDLVDPPRRAAASEALAAAPALPAAASGGEVSASSVEPDRRIGAVFLGSQVLHTCSGAVLDSRAGDLIITAAHCMADGVDAYFVPGFADDAEPQDFWHLDAVYLDPRWLSDQDPAADYAIARVSTDGGRSVESEADGGFVLGPAPHQGTPITVTGYALGIGGRPVGCSAVTAAIERGFPSLPCAGLSDGTSGSPWVSDAAIIGLTGGLDGGGCDENVSYSAPFGDSVVHLLERAEAGGDGDAAPASLGDGC